MPHDDYIEFTLGDGVEVRLELAAVGERPTPPQGGVDLPDGIAGVTPVGRGARVGELATDALRTVLSPLGPVLQQVHDAVRNIPDPPHEISVDFGIQVGQDLKIGIVGANGQASMTISATWQLPCERQT
ncbi:CU044_2847 family protein [Streptomyces sp. NBC_01381]|uniref:CU044_2847 family protein n=1 Tax=Streptomyces sp. NBC_01381 TaxID=2903845 RepID=UPI002250762A|nr:CU044_2847 family protein [Streptomyces sp. NBC_01381]MCX4671832.1 CU044_2847 family protein [Streptomyces sp. NBC_01381]